MITINIDPYIISLPIQIAWYGVLIAIGLASGLLIVLRLARNSGLRSSLVTALFLTLIPGGLIGAKLFHVLDELDFYLAHPALTAFWKPGFSQYGMIIGGLASAALYAYWKRLPTVQFFDLIPVPLLAGLSIGRVGCCVNGCCYGSITSLPWAFVYIHPNSFIDPEFLGVPTHPYPLYEIIWFLALIGILIALRSWLKPIKGAAFLIFLIGHAIGRFFLFFFRADPDLFVYPGGFAQAQIIALVILCVAVPLLVMVWRKG